MSHYIASCCDGTIVREDPGKQNNRKQWIGGQIVERRFLHNFFVYRPDGLIFWLYVSCLKKENLFHRKSTACFHRDMWRHQGRNRHGTELWYSPVCQRCRPQWGTGASWISCHFHLVKFHLVGTMPFFQVKCTTLSLGPWRNTLGSLHLKDWLKRALEASDPERETTPWASSYPFSHIRPPVNFKIHL